MQQEYARRIRDGSLRDALVEMGVDGAKDISQHNTLVNLRKVANHPFLFGEPRDKNGQYIGVSDSRLLVAASGKFRLLNRMLSRLKTEGHKVLIFSQMTKLLDILQDFLDLQSYSYCRIDGSVKMADRQLGIEEFNNDREKFIFLLSTRAGGLGINLQAADTCIIFDSDWNPHQDAQAQDRCHRIGQVNPVVVYRLLTVDSVDIDMMERQISKKKLDRLTILAGNFGRAGERSGENLTLKRLKDLLDDDVKNLSRMSSSAPDSAVGTLSAEISRFRGLDISEEELDLVMNRPKLFSDNSTNDFDGDYIVGIPPEGQMYDVVLSGNCSDTALQSIS